MPPTDRPLRVLHVVTLAEDLYGGPWTVARRQCEELERRGHRVELAGMRTQTTGACDDQLRLHSFRSWGVLKRGFPSSAFSIRYVFWLVSNLRRFDVVHIHFARDLASLVAASLAVAFRVPYVTQTHGMVVPDQRFAARAVDTLALRLLRRARVRFVLTDREAGALQALVGDACLLTELTNGVPVPPLGQPDPPSIPPRTPTVVFSARLHPRKRVSAFLDAAEHVVRRGDAAEFVVAGFDDGDGPSVEERLQSPVLSGRARWLGGLSHRDAQAIVAEAEIFVLPSLDEPYPMSLLEALSLGVPVICTESCGLAPVLKAHDAAVVIPDGGEADLGSLTGEAVSELLRDPVRRNALRTAGHALARRAFSAVSVGDRLEAAYVDLLA